ncbi:MAG TPA: hypothetical protein DCQ50_13180 [Chryseobacterium sp.]|nr:hypothetical protein [Chryseobacterium sp.]
MLKMNFKNHIFVFFTTTFLFTSCGGSIISKIADNGDKQSKNADSIELTTLVRNVYEWHETKFRRNGYPYKFNTPSDSIFIGVDWDAYEKDMEVFKKTGFFSKNFFETHKSIGLSIDSSIKQSSVKWRNINDGIPIWDTDADDWCGCQDYPDNYWKTLTLNNFIFDNGIVTFFWTWENKNEKQYKMKAIKEDEKWRISYIEGFTFYGTVTDYNIMIQK